MLEKCIPDGERREQKVITLESMNGVLFKFTEAMSMPKKKIILSAATKERNRNWAESKTDSAEFHALCGLFNVSNWQSLGCLEPTL